MEATQFKQVHPCSFPANPGPLHSHLIVVDIVDKAIFVGNAKSDEWQDFPCRLPIHQTHCRIEDLTVHCTCDHDVDQAVDIMFRTRIDLELFCVTVRRVSPGMFDEVFHENGNSRHTPEPQENDDKTGTDTREMIPEENLERAKENVFLANELEASFVGPEVDDRDDEVAHLLRNKHAGDICANHSLPIVDEDTNLSIIVQEFRDYPAILLSRGTGSEFARDTVITKDEFMSRLLLTGTMEMGFGQWETEILPQYGLGGPPELQHVDEGMALVEVLAKMHREGLDQVAVQSSQGKITGVLMREEIYNLIVRDTVRDNTARDRKSAGAHTVKRPIRFDVQDDPMDEMGPIRRGAAQWVSSPGTECFTMVLLLIDISLTIYDSIKLSPCVDCMGEWATTDDYDRSSDPEKPFSSELDCKERLFNVDCELAADIRNPLNMVTGVILGIFFTETLVRFFAWRFAMFRNILDLLDFLVVWASCATFLWMILGQGNKDLRQILTIGRVMRFLRLFRMAMWVRNLMSKNKNRYRQNGFDLDLTYVTDNCIAMSLPATGMEAKYRNPADEVVRFFRLLHQDHNGPKYLVFNLCAERQYSPHLFDGNVESFAAEDHHPCLLEQICGFVEQVEAFLVLHPKNVIAVHCKSGKGRTGMMVVCWLLYSGFSTEATLRPDVQPIQDALEWFALKRIGDRARHKQGVSQPSQRRFIDYFDKTMSMGGYSSPSLVLEKIIMYTTPHMDADGGCDPWFVIDQKYHEVFDYSKFHKVEHMSKGRQQHEFRCNDIQLRGDIRITFFDHTEAPPRDEKMFYIWFHTGFIENNYLSLNKNEIDGACSDTRGRVYSEEFRIELIFKPVEHGRVPHRKLGPASTSTYDLSSAMSTRLRMEAEEKTASSLKVTKKLRNNFLTSKVRNMVSGDKVRFQQDGFDLDLTYITKNVIAMGYPAQGREGFYRNPAEEVRRFFNLRHPNKYVIYNLCSEREYNLDSYFKDSTRVYPCHDHNPPPLQMICDFCQDCDGWLAQNPDHVAAVHCLAGKGRTGVMSCCYILHSGLLSSAAGSIEMFNELRSTTRKGVTNPCQIRYVHYYEQLLRAQGRGIQLRLGQDCPAVCLQSIRVQGFPGGAAEGSELHVELRNIDSQTEGESARLQYRSADQGRQAYSRTSDGVEFKLPQPSGVRLVSDVKLTFLRRDGGALEEVMSVFFNTTFVGTDFSSFRDHQTFAQHEIDPNRKSRFRHLEPSLSVTVSFTREGQHPLAGNTTHRSGSTPRIAKGHASATLDFASRHPVSA